MLTFKSRPSPKQTRATNADSFSYVEVFENFGEKWNPLIIRKSSFRTYNIKIKFKFIIHDEIDN